MNTMLKYELCILWKLCWFIFTPELCFFVFLFSLYQHKPIDYVCYVFPWWGEGVGWFLAISSMICVPAYAIYMYLVTPGTFSQKRPFPPSIGLYGKDPDYGRLCEFGALSTVWLHSVQRDDVSKFAGLGTRCVFVGYPRGMRAYKFLDPRTNKIIRTDNARIHEGHYYWEDRTPMLSQEEMQVWNDVTSRSSGQQIETDDDDEWIEV
ncbi:Sodium- and chloride-dependent GABA transporter 1 [Tyrophagus putrescentiae]|nr:Sodium- and chloride-dependent GABA transporter 1 [Tyrophagus putrescentiae]